MSQYGRSGRDLYQAGRDYTKNNFEINLSLGQKESSRLSEFDFAVDSWDMYDVAQRLSVVSRYIANSEKINDALEDRKGPTEVFDSISLVIRLVLSFSATFVAFSLLFSVIEHGFVYNPPWPAIENSAVINDLIYNCRKILIFFADQADSIDKSDLIAQNQAYLRSISNAKLTSFDISFFLLAANLIVKIGRKIFEMWRINPVERKLNFQLRLTKRLYTLLDDQEKLLLKGSLFRYPHPKLEHVFVEYKWDALKIKQQLEDEFLR